MSIDFPTEPPSIEDTTDLLTVVTDGEARLPCKAIGFPEPKIEWIQAGRSMLQSGGRYEIDEEGTLIITDVLVNLLDMSIV